jgi:hypothetical protein
MTLKSTILLIHQNLKQGIYLESAQWVYIIYVFKKKSKKITTQDRISSVA